MWQWTSQTSEIGNQTMALLMFWGSTKETMATSNCWNGNRMVVEWYMALPKLPCLLLSCPIRLFHQVLSYLLLSSSTSSIMFHSASFWPSQGDESHKVSRVSNLKVLTYLGYIHSILKRICESLWIWMALSSSSSSCWTFGASFAKGSDAVPHDPDIPFGTPGSKSYRKFRAVFAIASIACKDLAKKESCYKAATWHTACLAKISSHLLRLLANHATGSCLAPTQQVQGKDFTATMTSPIPLKWSPVQACTTFGYKCLYLKQGQKVQMSTVYTHTSMY